MFSVILLGFINFTQEKAYAQTFQQVEEAPAKIQNSSYVRNQDIVKQDYKYDRFLDGIYVKYDANNGEQTLGKFKKLENPEKSMVADPNEIPDDKSKPGIAQTVWRLDQLKKMTYTQLLILIREHHVERVRFSGDRRSVQVFTKATAPGGKRTEKVGLPWDPELYPYLLENGVFIDSDEVYPLEQQLRTYVKWFGPFVFAVIFFKAAFWLGSKADEFQTGGIFGQFRMKPTKPNETGVTFQDVAGVDQIKEEIMELVSFLQNPESFSQLGAQAPKGVLLCGPPGTGKTLLAKALSCEANVPFFPVSGTQFKKAFVGQGARRVRDMFKQARDSAPCIIFIDEFDGVGFKRSSGAQGDSDDATTTINQFLQEMDGFESNLGVVILAATNRPSVLDPAIIRPGRFDKVITMPLPNLQARVSILKVHSKGKSIDPSLDLEVVGKLTAGFTGAELMNVINTAALVAGRQDDDAINEDHVFQALESIQDQRSGLTQLQDFETGTTPPYLRRSFALYEAGRSILASMCSGYDQVRKVVICPNGRPRSFIQFIPPESILETGIYTQNYLQQKLIITIGGRCAERLALGDAYLSSRSTRDVEEAFTIATKMVQRYGFSELGLMATAKMPPQGDYVAKDENVELRQGVSEEYQKKIQEEVVKLLDASEAQAYLGISQNYQFFQLISQQLEEQGSLSQQEFQIIIDSGQFKTFNYIKEEQAAKQQNKALVTAQ